MKQRFGKIVLVLGVLAIAMGSAACSTDDDNMTTTTENTEGEDGDDNTQTGSTADIDSVELWSKRDGQRIYGVMYYDSKSAEKRKTVILSHSASLTHEAMSGYAKEIAKMGYAAYCFDFCGGSNKSKSDGKTDEMTVFTEVEDLRAVAKTVKAQEYVDPSQVILLGSSQGGLVSALLADECPDDFAGMILFYPAFNIPEMVKMFSGLGNLGSWGNLGGFGGMTAMGEAYIDSIKDFDVWSHIGKFAKPVCIIHGTNDIIVPISNSEKAVGLYPSATLNKIEGANHGFNAANLGSMGSMMGATADYDSQVMPIVKSFLKEM